MHRSTARRLGVALSTFALTLGLAAAAHADEPDLTVKGRVVDADGVGIAKISVYAISDSDLAQLESEDEEDDFDEWEIVQLKTTPSGRFSVTDGRLSLEGWNFAFVDERDVDSPFIVAEKHVPLQDPETDLGDVTLQPGAVVTGTVTTKVTGTPVRGLLVVLSTSSTIESPEDLTDLDETTRAGSFRFAGLEADTFRVFLGFDEDEEAPGPSATITVPAGQKVTRDITTLVPCRTSFTATSPTKGKVTFRAAAYAPQYGVTSPRGKVTIKRGSTTVKTVSLPRSGHTVSVSVSQKKGKKAYTASYSGGDCRSWKAKRSVTVR